MPAQTQVVSVAGIRRPNNAKPPTRNIPHAPGIPLRHEISKLYSSKDPQVRRQWTLFVLALEQFKSLPVDDPCSYFQIAGIHGYPMTAWNGVEEPAQDPEDLDSLPLGKDEFGGYCNHNSITFPTWHRAFLLLYEQCIWQNMKSIVHSWNLEETESEIWLNSADTWRLPYWDWGQEFLLPAAVTRDKVEIFPPASQNSSYPNPFPNPLRGFNNPEKDKNGQPLPFGSMPPGKRKWNIADNKNNKPPLPWSKCSGTSRYGVDLKDDSQGLVGVEGRNNVAAAHNHMSQCSQHWYSPFKGKKNDIEWTPPSDISDAIHRMFDPDRNATWGTFASTKWWQESDKEGPGYMSLEYIHNNVHNLCGGNKFSKDGGHGIGHMQDVPVAAFDPLFWLHHCNVDRLTAMWQCLNWELWWDKPEPEHPNLPGGNIADPLSSDPLLPFRRADNQDIFWTSDDVRDWTRLNYQYEDLIPSASAVLPNGVLNENKYQQDLREYIDLKYRSTEDTFHALMKPRHSVPRDISMPKVKNEFWNDYILDVIYDRYALKGSSYSIEFYFQDNLQKTYVGHIYSLGGLPITASSQTKKSCRNCKLQNEANVLSRTQVPLTGRLLAHLMSRRNPRLGSLDIKVVTTFLRQHLHCKFLRLGGAEAHKEHFPMTEVRLWVAERAMREFHSEGRGSATASPLYRLIDIDLQGRQRVLGKVPLLKMSSVKGGIQGMGEIRARL